MDINQINLDNKFKLVEASAGTGKSFTLAHLVLRNVLEKKIKPDEILLLSFTKNTCSELRDKILLRFQDLKSYLQNHNESNIDNTLKDWYLKFKKKEKSKKKIISEIDNFVNEIYKLQVTTFHSFCNNIIDEYSIEIGVTQDPCIENNLDNLYKDIIDNLWIDDFLNLNHKFISAVNKKKISTRFGSRINKSFFVEILKNIDQENICKFQINNKYKIIDLNDYFNEYFYLNWKEFCFEWNKKGKELFLQLIELGKLIKESGGRSQIYSEKPRNDKFNQIICWIEEINKRLNSKNVIDFIYDISKDDLLSKYFYNENISKEINKHNLKLDFTKFNLLQEKNLQESIKQLAIAHSEWIEKRDKFKKELLGLDNQKNSLEKDLGLLRRKRDELNASISNKRQDYNNYLLKLEYLERDINSLKEEMRSEKIKLENYKKDLHNPSPEFG